MSRVTKTDLEALVKVLNHRLGRPVNWGQPGNLHIQHAYGQPRLFENLSAGAREVSPRLPSGEMAQYIRAMLIGIDFAEANIRQAAPEWDGLPGWADGRQAQRLRARDIHERHVSLQRGCILCEEEAGAQRDMLLCDLCGKPLRPDEPLDGHPDCEDQR